MEHDVRPARSAVQRGGHRTWVLPGLALALPLTLSLSLSLALTLAVSGSALSADEPLSGPSLAPVDQTLIPQLPEFPPLWQAPPVALELSFAQPFGPQDKGGTYTDMGVGLPGQLTGRESALLELARAAVEASRAAGTLQVHTLTPPPAGDPAELERQKRAAMNAPIAITPTPGTGAPSDFLGDGLGAAAANRPAAVAPTPAELVKLAAARNGAGLVLLPPTTTPVVESTDASKRPVAEGK